MDLLDYRLPFPTVIGAAAARSFADLLRATLARGESNPWVDYTLPAPKWQHTGGNLCPNVRR